MLKIIPPAIEYMILTGYYILIIGGVIAAAIVAIMFIRGIIQMFKYQSRKEYFEKTGKEPHNLLLD